MGETQNIAKMAEILSNELFAEFFWKKTGPINRNWSCIKDEHKVKQHPSDVVFYYDEPYSKSRCYIQTDLKSYAKNSISKEAIQSALQSLAKQVACAETSTEWQDLYTHQGYTAEISGMLFVYNHDGEFDKDFSSRHSGIQFEDIDIPLSSRLVVLGPSEIFWLNNVAKEIQRMRGLGLPGGLPQKSEYMFFHPQLVTESNVQLEAANAATIEMLTGPWITIKYERSASIERNGIVIFYRHRGETVDEFVYLIDYIRHFQMLQPNTDIKVKLVGPHSHAANNFSKAQDRFIDNSQKMNQEDSLTKIIKSIKFESVQSISTSFSELEIGINNA